MPTLAILTHELNVLTTSWLVRLWLVAAVVGTFLVVAGNWASMQSAPAVASVMFSFLVFPWFLVVIVLGISPVTGTRLDALADGILSRPVTRHEYLFAALLARILVVLGVFLVVTLPAVVLIVFAKRPVPADGVTFYGVASALVIVSLVLDVSGHSGVFCGDAAAQCVAGGRGHGLRLVSRQLDSAHIFFRRVFADQSQPGVADVAAYFLEPGRSRSRGGREYCRTWRPWRGRPISSCAFCREVRHLPARARVVSLRRATTGIFPCGESCWGTVCPL